MLPLRTDFLHVMAEPDKAVFVLPGLGDPGPGVGEQGHEAVPDQDRVTEFPLHGVESYLPAVGPDTQDVGKVIDGDHAGSLG